MRSVENQSMERRQIILIGGVVILVLLVISFLIFRRKPAEPTTAPTTVELTAKPGSAFTPAVNELYQPDGDQLIIRDLASGEIKRRLDPKTGGQPIQSVAVSPNGKILLLLTGSPTAANFQIFEPVSGRRLALDPSITDAAFSPDSQRLAYHFLSETGGKSTLNLLPVAGGRFTELVTLPEDFPYSVFWPTSDQLFVIAEPTDLSGGLLYALDLKTKKLSEIPGFEGTTPHFSPSGQIIVFGQFVADKEGYQLAVLDRRAPQPRLTSVMGIPQSVAFSADERRAVVIIEEKLFRLSLDPGTGEPVGGGLKPEERPFTVMSKDNRLLIETDQRILTIPFP